MTNYAVRQATTFAKCVHDLMVYSCPSCLGLYKSAPTHTTSRAKDQTEVLLSLTRYGTLTPRFDVSCALASYNACLPDAGKQALHITANTDFHIYIAAAEFHSTLHMIHLMLYVMQSMHPLSYSSSSAIHPAGGKLLAGQSASRRTLNLCLQ